MVSRPFAHGHNRPFADGYYGGYYPLWFDGWADEQSYPEPVASDFVPLAPPLRPPAPAAAPSEPPKVIEVPGAAPAATAAKAEMPVVFIFRDGQRLEARRFTLTQNFLYVTAGSQPRTIPSSDLNLEATAAANRERGVNLIIPREPNEIAIGFGR